MIDTGRESGSGAIKTLFRKVFAAFDLVIIVGEAAAGDADAEIGVFAECVPDAEFGINVGGGNGQPERQVRVVEKVGAIAVIEGVG